MRIAICKTPSMTDWYAYLLSTCFSELGHESFVTENGADCARCDIGLYALYGHPLEDRLRSGRPECVALVNTEQILNAGQFGSWFTESQRHADVILETAPELLSVARAMTDKPVIEFPIGWHEFLEQHDADVIAEPPWDVFSIDSICTENRARFHKVAAKELMSYNANCFDFKTNANCARWSPTCLTVHSYGSGSALSSFRVIGMFINNKAFVACQRTSYPYLKEDEHIVYFDTPDEMVRKLKHFIRHQDEARSIAGAAYSHIRTLMPMVETARRAVSEMLELVK